MTRTCAHPTCDQELHPHQQSAVCSRHTVGQVALLMHAQGKSMREMCAILHVNAGHIQATARKAGVHISTARAVK